MSERCERREAEVPTRSPFFAHLSLRQLEIFAVIAPIVFMSAVYVLILGPVHPAFHSWPGFVLLTGMLALAVWLFTSSVFRAVRGLQQEIEALSRQTEWHNAQLVALHTADLALMRETHVEGALQGIPQLAVRLLGGCHAALSSTATGASRIETYPALPATLAGRCCEVAEAVRDGRQPAEFRGHARLLVVPLAHLGVPIGSLAVARGDAGAPFAPLSEEIARMFATHAAMVIENDRLYDEVRVLAIEGERQALAREMHDSLAQVLAFVNTKAQAVELYLRDQDIVNARQQMAELSAAAREVYAEIRQGIGALRLEIGGKTLRELLADGAERFADSTGLEVRLEWHAGDKERELPPDAELQLLRIVQEALANVRRHAAARHVLITVEVVDARLELRIAEDGRGCQRGAARPVGLPRFGLQTMTERARALGGVLVVDNRPAGGTRVQVSVPLREPSQSQSGTDRLRTGQSGTD